MQGKAMKNSIGPALALALLSVPATSLAADPLACERARWHGEQGERERRPDRSLHRFPLHHRILP